MVVFDNEKKISLCQELGINIDGDLFDPRYDYVFKRIFTADEVKSKIALIHFLNAMLNLSGDDVIVDLTVINPEIPVDNKRQKRSVFDIRVQFKMEKKPLWKCNSTARMTSRNAASSLFQNRTQASR